MSLNLSSSASLTFINISYKFFNLCEEIKHDIVKYTSSVFVCFVCVPQSVPVWPFVYSSLHSIVLKTAGYSEREKAMTRFYSLYL